MKTNKPTNSRPIHTTVFYHANCPDGATAALVAFKKLGYAGVQYLASSYQKTDLPDNLGETVYILDFSFSRTVMQALEKKVRKIVLLDHHKTAADELAGYQCACGLIHFDLSKSGARLAFEYFFKDQPVPELVKYIEDRDLWNWQYPQTKAFLAYVDHIAEGYSKFRKLEPLMGIFDGKQWVLDPEFEKEILLKGESFEECKAQQIQRLAAKPLSIELAGHSIFATNAPAELRSELGNVLALRSNSFSLIYQVLDADTVKCSLRSIEGMDMTPLAQHFGGGGHPESCGFFCSIEVLQALLRGQYKDFVLPQGNA